jgi:hypothetical protein
MSYQRLLVLATVFAVAALLTLVLRIAHPHHRQLALTLYGIGWIPFAMSIRQFWIVHDGQVERVLQWKVHLAIGFGLVVLAWAFKVLIPVERSPLREVDLMDLPASLEADLQQLSLVDDKMQAVATELEDSSLVPAAQLSTDESRKLRAAWTRFIESSFELELLKTRYRSFFQINGFTHPKLHAQAFVIAYGAFVSQYRAASVVTTRIGQHETVRKLLDDAHPSTGIPAGSFARIQWMVSHPDEILRLNAGRAYLKLMKRRLEANHQQILRTEDQLSEITHRVLTDADAFVNNPLDLLEHHASNAWYPVQKGVALGMASIRTTSRDYFISHADLEAEQANLLPGDIMLTRREWHLTNLGIPGYWTHAALHIGSLDRLDQYFADLDLLDGRAASAVIRDLFPKVYAAMSRVDERGETALVIEALRPGVIVQSLQNSASADSLAVLRPKVTKSDRWQAVVAALPHHGKPYNYQFDFRTESALVCSQLVCKAYQTIPGLHLKPEMSGGRLLYSPNEIAIKFDRERDTPNNEMDLILFLDGTGFGKVTQRGADEFRASWSRPKWHIVFDGE